ncbi:MULTISPECIES: helix-turn-helix transcriptional regulator [unclassified Microbacterium]|uniref:helix-turn-helix transcriptional regulator n=1 Tax=unclassified Microbacterium TaxID=2609290 RepID=UPI001F102E96|nr:MULTISPECIES: helix-turn-helix transcriptional regulator [unclassified Microbacterium]UUE20064.1 helix-turn-helix transcriptional regulator [Microbacterium sp. J1-1]
MGTLMPSVRAFAQFVRRTRLARNITQDELAQAVGKSRRWVHDLENGKVDPSLSAAVSVAAALEYTVSLELDQPSGDLDQLFEDL